MRRLRVPKLKPGTTNLPMKMKDDEYKKAQALGDDQWVPRVRSFHTRVVYGLCFIAAVCSIALWGFKCYRLDLNSLGEGTNSPPVFGPKKLTPEELREHLAEIDRGLKAFLNSSKPFTKFGPPVMNWDKTRADAIRRSTNSSNGVNPKPRIMLITSSHPKKCENKQGDQMLLKSIKNKMDYCRLHGIELYYNMDHIDEDMTSWWVKTFLTHMLMKQHPEIDWFWWMDSDAIFTDMTFELPLHKYEKYNMVMHGWDDAVYDKRSWLGLNAGVFLIRNCQWSMDFLHAWAPMSPKGKIRDGAGEFLTKALPDRGKGEADDQSGIVYLMITDRERWGSKIFLENSYYFQGYWRVLTDKFEEMMAKYKPGLYGDDRWPFVTHFCGCEFCCGSINPEYTRDQCLVHMERAINFADNQVIGRYGFRHKSLKTPEVSPKSNNHVQKNQTSNSMAAESKKA
ncbi:xyloglucan 6-xylosyltransferase 1 isoform X1 [Physcomitrium patens]|nr:xyloglucan 6-xylosyltransferase 1-like isoform X1 [Physcomitrium patens]XP_024374066.1 xyloglucan 6-xylosyltransferase 1-like isoform X1 [Physcomitrium patens]XP_024374068.1 xyloglucan 6-xylosyltransferase 1-like isoform X1 [Physcomitrium patens]XP_024374069.1 xyloglucan 6-xylosyltransferase 1-like isoform X1 [Physcomitrium patens]XP_024374070.1 xyloglucan 6-xylosyltransferase 1-like isoform X1 [Physcomitrium patens]XP_024374071.1 xyloglucan 6-xylosyltransferase 1-like isoform X1 [Physcomit|eukprot:XP_024374065.1 xyloglucan 6-xylosyltransferase 1-like isoform X1 [Physcomitrella patens]